MITLRGSGDVQIASAHARRFDDEVRHYAKALADMPGDDPRRPEIGGRLVRSTAERDRWHTAIKKFELDGFYHGE